MKNNNNKSLLSSGLKLSVLTLLSRIMGLIREVTKAKFLGTSIYADAFGIAFLIPNLFRRLFAENSISVAFIPTFRGYLENEKDDKRSTQDFLNATLTIISFFTSLVVIIGMILAPIIVKIFYKEQSILILSETSYLTRIMFPYLFVISIAAFFQGILNTVNIFSPSGFTPILFNLSVVLATYFLAPHTANSARAMSIGVLVGGCLQAAFQLPFVLKTGWKVSFTGLKKAFTNKGTKKVIALVIPTIIGMASYQLNDLVSTALAGRSGEGIVSSLQYSLRLQELILGIFAVSIGTVILPDMAGFAKKGDWKKYNDMLIRAIKIICFITIPITFYSLITGRELISIVYKSRNFDETSVALTLSAFRFHIIGLFFIAANRIISPAFYAQGNTKLPTLAGIISFGVNIVLAFVFSIFWKGAGIALALSIASFVNLIFLFIFLKTLKTTDVTKVVLSSVLYSLKMIIFSAIASVPSFFLHRIFVKRFISMGRFLGNGIPIILTALVFAIIGIALLAITKDSSIQMIKNKLSRKTESEVTK